MTLRRSIAALTALLAMFGFIPYASAFDVTINGRPASDLDSGAAVAVDPVTGAIFVTGNRQTTPTSSSFFVAKYLPDGTRQWVQEVDGVSGEAIAVDASGFVIAGGLGSGSATKADVVVVKLDGRRTRKNVIWTRTLDIGQSNDVLNGLALTPDGGAVIVGTAIELGVFFMMKFDSNGQDAWPAPRLIAGTLAGGPGGGNAVVVLPDGDIVATGGVSNTITNGDLFVGRFDAATGSLQWQFTLNGSPLNGDDRGLALTLAPDGDIVVLGIAPFTSPPFNNLGFLVIKLSAAGSLRWTTTIDGGFNGRLNALAVGPDGDVFVGGTLPVASGPGNRLFVVLSLDDSGNERWRYAAPGESFFLGAFAIAFDGSGNPIVTGVSSHPDAITAFELLAFEKLSGAVLWRTPILGSVPLVNRGADVVSLPGTDTIVAVGTTQNGRTSSDITIVRVTGGHEDWRALITGRGKRIDRDDNVLAMAVRSPQDAVALAGYTENTCCTLEGDAQEFRVAKVRKTGKVAWKFDLADPMPHLNNAALAVSFGADGEIYAAGRTCAYVVSCFTVVRVSQQGDEVWRATIPGTIGGRGEARALLVDDADHTVIAAGVEPTATSSVLAVYKLDADTGAIRWSYLSDVVGAANAMTMTGRGTVAIAAQLFGRFAVLELDAQSGAPTTSVDLGAGVGQSIVYDEVRDQLVAGGNLFAGSLSFPTAVKLDRDGTRMWTFAPQSGSIGLATAKVSVNQLDGSIGFIGTGVDAQTRRAVFTATHLSTDGQVLFDASAQGVANGVAFAGTTMIVAGQLDVDQQFGSPDSTFAVLAFAEDGTEVWRRTAHGNLQTEQGNPLGTNSASSVAVDNQRGTIFAAGVLTNAETSSDMFAVGLRDNGDELPGFQTAAPE